MGDVHLGTGRRDADADADAATATASAYWRASGFPEFTLV
jgi:hypothetical protein